MRISHVGVMASETRLTSVWALLWGYRPYVTSR